MARGSSSGKGGNAITGTVLEMTGESGQLDNRGKAVIRKKYFLGSEGDLGKIPPLTGYRAVNATYNKLLDDAYEQTVEYAATVPANGDLVEQLNGVEGTFEMFCSYETVPIERHPKIDKLSLDYGGYFTMDGYAKWPPFYTEGGGGGLGSGDQKRNPMFGVTSYKDVSMTFRHTYYLKNLNRGIYDRAGKVVENLPAGFPTPKGPTDKNGKELRRRWMLQMPAISREGESYRIVQDYVLLDSSGITEGLYEVTSTPGSA